MPIKVIHVKMVYWCCTMYNVQFTMYILYSVHVQQSTALPGNTSNVHVEKYKEVTFKVKRVD